MVGPLRVLLKRVSETKIVHSEKKFYEVLSLYGLSQSTTRATPSLHQSFTVLFVTRTHIAHFLQ